MAALLGTVVVRFAGNYLMGEAGRERFLTQLQITLAGVVCVVLTDHMLVLWLGWVVISLSLHRLLLFYPDRPRAALAAHKKFLLARLAEGMLLAAAVLLYVEFDTFQISDMRATLAEASAGGAAQLAALLIAGVALIKCAQLPVHGWLIQVVETPTPVSALLHAGVINLGGYLLITFAPLLEQVPQARWLVLIVAGITLVMASLIMSQQTSVKVRLAWSTSAQMGLMLVQCALGLYTMALLHLFAHACYKAYSFLSAGSSVELQRMARMAPRETRGPVGLLTAVLLAGGAVFLVAQLIGPGGAISPWLLLVSLVVFLLLERGGFAAGVPVLGAASLSLVLMVAFIGQKMAIAAVFPTLNSLPPLAADLWLSALVVVMAAVFWILRERADTRWARAVSAKLAAGLYLDEWFTRMTLAIWPLRLPDQKTRAHLAGSSQETA
jgi:NAD(P)H-quinone oxidoreductase subunit 5